MATNNNGREVWVERAQVLSMLLVVLHHCVPHGYDGPEWLLNLLNAIQYPALVCFFFTSGLFAPRWKRSGYLPYLKKRALRLLTPYFCVNLLMLAPRYAAARLMGVQVRLTAAWVLTSFLNPHGQGIAPHLWFLPALFLMAALLPLIDAATKARGPRLLTLAVLLALSALPVRLTTLFCLNELKLYLAFYVLGYALAESRGTGRLFTGPSALASGLAGLAVFALTLLFAALPLGDFLQRVGGGLALLALSCLGEGVDPLTAAFRGKTFTVYILSMCAQNLAEAVGYSARWPWPATALAMLAIGLAVPCAVCAWHQKRPLPRWLRLVVGL